MLNVVLVNTVEVSTIAIDGIFLVLEYSLITNQSLSGFIQIKQSGS
jgi:hypothetical protein